MEEEDVLKLALKSLSFEQESLKQAQTNYDVFRKQVSRPILQLFEMSRSDSNRCSWKNGVNRAMQMQTMFNASTRLQSPRQLRLLSKYDGGSPRLASVIDVRRPNYFPWGEETTKESSSMLQRQRLRPSPKRFKSYHTPQSRPILFSKRQSRLRSASSMIH